MATTYPGPTDNDLQTMAHALRALADRLDQTTPADHAGIDSEDLRHMVSTLVVDWEVGDDSDTSSLTLPALDALALLHYHGNR